MLISARQWTGPARLLVVSLGSCAVAGAQPAPVGCGELSGRIGADVMLAELEAAPATTDLARAMRSLLRESGAELVALAPRGATFDAGADRLARAVAGLIAAPEAVLATPGLLWHPPALALDVSTHDWRRHNAHLHDGRRLARLVALRAASLPWPQLVVMRSAALGDDLPADPAAAPAADPAAAPAADRAAAPAADPAAAPAADRAAAPAADPAAALFGSLVVSLLVRGFAWSDEHLGWADRPAWSDSFDLAAHDEALVAAAALGVLEAAEVEQARRSTAAGVSDDVAARARAAARAAAAAVPPSAAPPVAPRLPAPRLVAREGPLRRFLIAAPDYETGSAGPMALHMLCDRLNRQGYEATIALIDRGPGFPALGTTNPDWITPTARHGQQFERFVAVYPENLVGNPLGSPFVVRWLLHRPSYFTGVGMSAGPDDLVVAWHDSIAPGLPVLGLPLVDLSTYYPGPPERHGRLLWVGKGDVPPDLDRSDMTELTRAWPASQRELAAELRHAEMLVTCDWLTSLTDEALLCGTPVVFAGEQQWGPGQPMLAEQHLAPGVIHRLDGRPDPGELLAARAACEAFRHAYLDRIAHLGDEIDGFARLVNAHFDDVARRQPAAAAAGAAL